VKRSSLSSNWLRLQMVANALARHTHSICAYLGTGTLRWTTILTRPVGWRSYQLLRVLPRAYTGEMAGSMHFRHLASCQRMCILSPSRCVMDYVIKNPVNAGLVAEPKDWPYTYGVGRT
jgi:hypothetical protein